MHDHTKILFITESNEDYLADSLLIGFRNLCQTNCVDYPKKDILYNNYPENVKNRVRGNGFTLYTGLLEDLPVDRACIFHRLIEDEFDLVIFSNIWRQYGLFVQWYPYLKPKKTIICDGTDSPQVYPYAGLWWRRPSQWFIPKAHKKFSYFKREWTSDSQFNFWHRLIPSTLRNHIPAHKNLRRVCFSIPKSKIVREIPVKTKDFATHCVDPEVAKRVPGCKTNYAFMDEASYYADLQASRFAITTKRAGWDCLRHYEVAANGCVPCFKDLGKKPETCAPHGLVHMANCISYSDFEELLATIRGLDYHEEINLRKMALDWANQYSCSNVAKDLLDSSRCD